MYSIFEGVCSMSNYLERSKKVLGKCLLGRKILLDYTQQTVNFHNRCHTKRLLPSTTILWKCIGLKMALFLPMNSWSSYSVNFRLSHLVKSGNRPAGTGGARGIQLPPPPPIILNLFIQISGHPSNNLTSLLRLPLQRFWLCADPG